VTRAPALAVSGLLTLVLPLLAGCAQEPAPVRRSAPVGPVQTQMLQGEAAARHGDVDGAIEVYRAAIARDPAAVRPHLRYVRAMLAQGRGAEVRVEYQARSERPGASDAERTLAQRLQTNGASSALRQVYREATLRAPGSPWWLLALAEVETMEADAWNRKRLSAIERGDREAEEQAFAQSRGAVRRANRAVERAGRLAPELAEVWLYRGYLRSVEGDLQRAEAGRLASYEAAQLSFETATQRDPDLVEAWTGLGEASFELGEQRESLVAYLHAVRQAPVDGELRMALGVVLHDIGLLRDAAAQYREAAALRPWDADPLLRLGDALADAENWNLALSAYEAALERDAEAVDGHYKMGAVLEFRNRPGEARAAYERYVAMDGERSDLVKRRIERLLRAERP
jgi:tetratricopeptide (TPR) repeat protein